MLTLSIQHNIYLNSEERHKLHSGVDVQTVGVSVPVWHLDEKTSEPAKEVFCNYYLKNPKKEIPIKILEEGYLICLPYRLPNRDNQRTISDQEWLEMTQEQRETYYTSQPKSMSSNSLLDITEGGSESLMYREQNKLKKKDQYMRVVHYVNILDIKYLEGSFYYEKSEEDSGEESDSEEDSSEEIEGEDN